MTSWSSSGPARWAWRRSRPRASPARPRSSRWTSPTPGSNTPPASAPTTINSGSPDVEGQIAALTSDGLGVDVAIEAVGIPETLDLCARVVRPGGVVANIGVHGAPTTLHLEELWIKNITITTGLVDGTTVPMLMQLIRSGKIAGELFGTHEFGLHDMLSAYDTFAEAGKNNALKVVIKK